MRAQDLDAQLTDFVQSVYLDTLVTTFVLSLLMELQIRLWWHFFRGRFQ
jgi:hypothetical protein